MKKCLRCWCFLLLCILPAVANANTFTAYFGLNSVQVNGAYSATCARPVLKLFTYNSINNTFSTVEVYCFNDALTDLVTVESVMRDASALGLGLSKDFDRLISDLQDKKDFKGRVLHFPSERYFALSDCRYGNRPKDLDAHVNCKNTRQEQGTVQFTLNGHGRLENLENWNLSTLFDRD